MTTSFGGRRNVRRLTVSVVVVAALVGSVPVAAGARTPSGPWARGTDAACAGVSGGRFVDVSGPHADAVGCVAGLGISRGSADPSRYLPGRAVTRAQMASFVDRFYAVVSGSWLPAGGGEFSDVSGVHAEAIGRLAAAGIVQGRGAGRFEPDAAVTRGQMASFLVRAVDLLDDGRSNGSVPPVSSVRRFADATGTHGEAIERLAAAGVVQGFADGSYGPSGPVTRGQMASYLARTLDLAVVEGWTSGLTPLTPGGPDDPDPEPEPEPVDTGLTLTPATATRSVGDQHRVTTVVRQDGAPVADATVLFEVYETLVDAGETTGFDLVDFVPVVTDAAGIAAWSYTSPVDASDVIVACLVDDPATDVCVPDPAQVSDADLPVVPEGLRHGTARVRWTGGEVPEPTVGTLEPGPVTLSSSGGSLQLVDVGLGLGGPVLFDATLGEDGTLTVPQDGISFPTIREELDPIDLAITPRARSGATGTFDAETGHVELTFDLAIEVRGSMGETPVFGADGACGTPTFTVRLTTDASGMTRGVPLREDGSLTFYDAETTIPRTAGCGEVPGIGDVDAILDDEIGFRDGEDRSRPGEVQLRLPAVASQER